MREVQGEGRGLIYLGIEGAGNLARLVYAGAV